MEKRYFFVEEKSGGRVWAEYLGTHEFASQEEEEAWAEEEYEKRRDPLNPASWIMTDEQISQRGWCDGYALDHIEEMGNGYIVE